MNAKPPKCTRRLITFTGEADENLRAACAAMKINHSLAVREGIRLYVQELQKSGALATVNQALKLGSRLVTEADLASDGVETETQR